MQSKRVVLPLEDCLDALIDYRGKTPTKTDQGIPLVTAKVVKGGRIDAPTEFIAEDDFASWMTRGLPSIGDVVMTTEAPLGEVAQIRELPVALAQRIVTLRGKPGLLSNDYLLYVMQSEPFQAQLRARATGTTVVGIKQSELRKVSLELPPMPEQISAVSVLRQLDRKIDVLRSTNDTIDAIARLIFKSWFVDFDPVNLSDAQGIVESTLRFAIELLPRKLLELKGGRVPAGWTRGAVSALADLNPTSWTSSDHPVTIAYIDLSNVKNNRVDEVALYSFGDAPSRARRSVQAGDTIIGTVRPGNRSFAYIAKDRPGLTASTGFAVLRPRSSAYRSFVYLASTVDSSIERLANLADGGAYPAVRGEVVADTPVVLPPHDVLEAFESLVGPLLMKQAANVQQQDVLARLRDTLLPGLISGKLKPVADHLREAALQ